jgi:hypothetical protein
MKPIFVTLSLVCFAIIQPQLLKGQGATQFQHDCATCHACAGSAVGPAISLPWIERSGWLPLVSAMDWYGGYGFTAIFIPSPRLDRLSDRSPSALLGSGGSVRTCSVFRDWGTSPILLQLRCRAA